MATVSMFDSDAVLNHWVDAAKFAQVTAQYDVTSRMNEIIWRGSLLTNVPGTTMTPQPAIVTGKH